MSNPVRAIVRHGRIELIEPVDLLEGTPALVTLLPDEAEFWARASEPSAADVWDNAEDDVYAELLKG